MEWDAPTPHYNNCRCRLKRRHIQTPTMGHLKGTREEEVMEDMAKPTPKQLKLSKQDKEDNQLYYHLVKLKNQISEYVEKTEEYQEDKFKLESKHGTEFRKTEEKQVVGLWTVPSTSGIVKERQVVKTEVNQIGALKTVPNAPGVDEVKLEIQKEEYQEGKDRGQRVKDDVIEVPEIKMERLVAEVIEGLRQEYQPKVIKPPEVRMGKSVVKQLLLKKPQGNQELALKMKQRQKKRYRRTQKVLTRKKQGTK